MPAVWGMGGGVAMFRRVRKCSFAGCAIVLSAAVWGVGEGVQCFGGCAGVLDATGVDQVLCSTGDDCERASAMKRSKLECGKDKNVRSGQLELGYGSLSQKHCAVIFVNPRLTS